MPDAKSGAATPGRKTAGPSVTLELLAQHRELSKAGRDLRDQTSYEWISGEARGYASPASRNGYLSTRRSLQTEFAVRGI